VVERAAKRYMQLAILANAQALRRPFHLQLPRELVPPAVKGGTWTDPALYASKGGADGRLPAATTLAPHHDGNTLQGHDAGRHVG